MKTFPLLLALVGVGAAGYLAIKHAQAKKAAQLPNGTIKLNEVVLINGTVVQVSGFERIIFGKENDIGEPLKAYLEKLGTATDEAKTIVETLALFEDGKLGAVPYAEFVAGPNKYLVLIDDDRNYHLNRAPKQKATVFRTAV